MDRLENVLKETDTIQQDKKKDHDSVGPPPKPFSRKRQQAQCFIKATEAEDPCKRTTEGAKLIKICEKKKSTNIKRKIKKSICPRPWAFETKQKKNKCEEKVKTPSRPAYETCSQSDDSSKKKGHEALTNTFREAQKNETNCDKRSAKPVSVKACNINELEDYKNTDDCSKKSKRRDKNVNKRKKKSICPRPWGKKN